ncbi:MAG: hypothetical protein LUF04_14675, partial [Bacteroides sp.]|nr:hypothetical protein [Bacteroides sp.]
MTHRARVTDFCLARHYDEKREAWKKKNPIWYSEQAEDYQDGSRTAAVMFLTDEFIKIREPFRIENFRMYKGVSLPNRNNMSPYVSISNYLEEEENPMNETLETLRQVLEHKKQIILQGAPGTGKTYTAKDLAEGLICGQVSRNKTTQASRLRESDRCYL